MFEKLNLEETIKSIHVIDKYKFKVTNKKNRKKVQHKITNIIRYYGIPNTHYEYVRAIGNGMAHGSCPVKCYIYVGDHHQLLCVIRDVGEGFDYNDVIKKYRQKQVYFHHKGYGFRCYAKNSHVNVDWMNHGRTIILFYDTS